jgi:bifunctional non-homologous end joining protein LigD
MAAEDEYTKKRNDKSPEPKSGEKPRLPANHFVIQKHAATRLHYDFRIQVGETLISWAVPKGPPTEVGEKRLAVKVEDHPLAYMYFEGTIPKGEYGGGTVMVWDIGYYFLEGIGGSPKPEQVYKSIGEKKLKIHLRGNRLRGLYTLVKSSAKEENQWLLIKSHDEEGNKEDRSILTYRTLEEIETKKEQSESKKVESRAPSVPKQKKATKRDFPGFTSPMLATAVGEFYQHPDWLYELKLDGYRILGLKNGDEVHLLSRNENAYTSQYQNIADEIKRINAEFIIDGEVCYLDSKGKSDFQKLQNLDGPSPNLVYFVFDLLWLSGHELTDLPLTQRKELLEKLVSKTSDQIRYVPHERDGEEMMQEARKSGQEGIMLKRAGSVYESGRRSKDWLKYKFSERQELLICGYLPSDKRDSGLKSLLCAYHFGDELVYAGKVGTGFDEASGKQLVEALHSLERKTPPLDNPPQEKGIVWVKPELVCEVRFTEWTDAGHMRHPSFLGLRSDKKPDEIRLEFQAAAPPQNLPFDLSNPEKLFWEKKQITKKDVFDYYNNVADLILPYLKDRPLSLYRTPDGAEKKGFFQKDVSEIAPDWLDTIAIGGKEKTVEYALCQSKEALLYLVNLGCVEFNPWNALAEDPEMADLLVIDLDPLDVSFEQVVEVGLKVKRVLDELSIVSFPKTSGSKGLHIFVPIVNNLKHSAVQAFAKRLLQHVRDSMPDLTSMERSPSKRKGKVYLDFLQNGRGKTMASVYSLRPVEAATVSVPLSWNEVNSDLNPTDFTIPYCLRRFQMRGDVWEGFFASRIDLKKKFGLK